MTIDGDGFIQNATMVYIVGANYTYEGSNSYSRIEFQTPRELIYQNVHLNLFVYVGSIMSECLLSSCDYSWSTSVTPVFHSVNPMNIRGRTNLTITGENLLPLNGSNVNATIEINGNICNVTQIRNDSIRCEIEGVEAGIHPIEGSIDGIGSIESSLNITGDAIVSSISPSTTGIHGGAILTIDGHGFTRNESDIQVNIGSNPCLIIESREDQIECEIPRRTTNVNNVNIQIISHQISFPSSSLRLNYSESITPNVSSISPNFGSGSQTVNINGNNFIGPGQTDVFIDETPCNITSVSMTSINCVIQSTLSAGNHSIDVFVEDIGHSNEDIFYRHDLTLRNITPSEGGYGGGLITTIEGNGFNGSNVSISICNRSCLSIDIRSNNAIDCLTPSMTMLSPNTLCNVSVSVDGITKDTQFTYRSNLTATIISVSPNRGGTGGGTLITINGTNFPLVFFFFFSLFN